MDPNSSQETWNLSSEIGCVFPNGITSEMKHRDLLQNYKPDKCDQSFNTYFSKDSLGDQVSSNPSGPLYSCETCNMSFESVSCLEMLEHNCDNQNQRIIHEEPRKSIELEKRNEIQTTGKSFQCNVCLKFLCSRYSLNTHVRQHTGEEPYQCDVCDKTFKEKGYMAVHKRKHTGEKPYPCTECDKAFMKSCALTRHMRLHTGERLYQCEVCEECFRISDNLRVHMRIHTGEKPYRCESCKKYFRHQNTLNYHKCNTLRGKRNS